MIRLGRKSKPPKVKEADPPSPEPPVHIPGRADVYQLSPAVVDLDGPPTTKSEAILSIANQLAVTHLGQGRRGFAVCGVSSGVGVSFMAANLASAFAHGGTPSLLIDANLRRPGLETYFRPAAPSQGLLQILRGETDLHAVVHDEVLPNLSLVYAGAAAPQEHDLLSSRTFAELIRSCMRDYACTVVDTSAANRSADALSAAVAVGYAVLVARRGDTYIDDVAFLRRQLVAAGVTILGSVLNEGP
jgi:protein-tyrosine kinase